MAMHQRKEARGPQSGISVPVPLLPVSRIPTSVCQSLAHPVHRLKFVPFLPVHLAKGSRYLIRGVQGTQATVYVVYIPAMELVNPNMQTIELGTKYVYITARR